MHMGSLSWEPWASSLKYLADKMDSPCWSLYEDPLPTSAHHIRLPHSLGWEQVVAAPCSALQRTEGENTVSMLNTSLTGKMAARRSNPREGNPLCSFF